MKKPPPTTTRKPHRPAKPPAPPKQPGPGTLISVHSRPPPGHGGGGKHGGTGKHQPPKKHRPPPKRKLSLGDVACCAAEALAASLRLAGVSVSDEDVLALYWRTAADADAGATLSETLEAASVWGLAGRRPSSFGPVPLDDPWQPLDEGHQGVILGLDLPGPHAVLDDGSAWWSWGEPWSLADWPDAVIQEAWEVTWAL